ncbi:MAG: hypothetical protein ACRERS_02055, partial [Methylococcales bacterium]
LMNAETFNPFILPRNRWQHRRLAWHFHEREYAVWLGEEEPVPKPGIAICLRLPWGQQAAAAGIYTIEPQTIHASADLRELAALVRLKQQALSPEVGKIVELRLQKNRAGFVEQHRNAWSQAMLVTPEGKRERAPRLERAMNLDRWLENLVLLMLRRTYPAFERFAPANGPLPREAWPRFMRFALHEDIGKADADDYVRLIREAYLVPMGLLRRKGRDYVMPGKLDNLELVKLLMPMLKHNPSPKMIHQRFSEPVYGLVPDQINLLLVFLLLQGEIEVFKDQRSYRDAFETLENPLHYDRVELGQSLPVMELAAITRLAEALNLKLPQQWTLLAQKRAIENIREAGRQQSEQLQPLLKSLRADPTQGSHLCEQVQAYLQDWNVLRKGAEPLKGFQDFLSSIESIDSFIQQIPKFNLLQKRLPGLIEESQRFQHLFSNPVLQEKILRALNPQQSQLPEVPDLDNPDDLESWLGQARTVYADYKKSYSQAHAQWWARQTSHPALNWQAPLVANSRHIGLGDAVKRIRELQQRALQQRCRGLVNLDYQPLCSCGFDGESAPLAILIDECEKLEQDTERKLESFFQQDQVKETIGTWRSSADPAVQADLTQYLSGSRIIPRIHDLCWFDRNLSGDATLADGDLESVLRLLEEKIWEAEGLQKALTEHLARYAGRRIRFVHSRASSETSEELILWCAEQCLRFGVPLPERMSTRDLNRIQACLRPEWVGDQA